MKYYGINHSYIFEYAFVDGRFPWDIPRMDDLLYNKIFLAIGKFLNFTYFFFFHIDQFNLTDTFLS
jgi:hypothetical protein